jgi:hypothetical protein
VVAVAAAVAVAVAVAAIVVAAVVAAAVVAAVEAAVTKAVTKTPRRFAQTATNWLSTRRLIVTGSQQTRTRFLPGTSPPNWTDRDRGPSIVSISMIGKCIMNQQVYPNHHLMQLLDPAC